MIVEQAEPSTLLHWEFWPLPALQEMFNSATNLDWEDTISEAAECMRLYKDTQNLPSPLHFDTTWRPWRDIDLLTFVQRNLDLTMGSHQGANAPRSLVHSKAVSPVLRRIAAHLMVEEIIIEDSKRHQIARIQGAGLVAVSKPNDFKCAIDTASRLCELRINGEPMTFCVNAEGLGEKTRSKLISKAETMGVQAAIGLDADEILQKFYRLPKK